MGRHSKNAIGTKATKGPDYVPKVDRYCVLCDREFVRPCEYLRHRYLTLLHNPLGAKQFTCQICSKQFTLLCNMTNHYRTHTGQVEICRLPLDDGGDLGTCQKSYTDLPNLHTHMRRDHLGPFRKAGLSVPDWLLYAYKNRKLSLSQKVKRNGATRKQQNMHEFPSPSNAAPLPEPNPTVQVYSAATMEAFPPTRIAIENHRPYVELSTDKNELLNLQLSDVQLLDAELRMRSFGDRNQSALASIDHNQSTLGFTHPSGIPPVNLNPVFEASPSLNLDIAQPSHLPDFDTAQPSHFLNFNTTQPSHFLNFNTAQPSHFPNFNTTQSWPLPNLDTTQPLFSYDHDVTTAFLTPNANTYMWDYGALGSFNDFPTCQTNFSPEVASGIFPQLPENQFLFYNQPLVAPQLASVSYFADEQQAQINLFDYSLFTSDETLIPALPFDS